MNPDHRAGILRMVGPFGRPHTHHSQATLDCTDWVEKQFRTPGCEILTGQIRMWAIAEGVVAFTPGGLHHRDRAMFASEPYPTSRATYFTMQSHRRHDVHESCHDRAP